MNAPRLSQNQVDWCRNRFDAIVSEISGSLIGKRPVIEYVVATVIAGGHVLLEDVPGTGKTALARDLATVIGGEHTRVQFTPDLLPSDITGTLVFDQRNGSFRFHKGPVFTNILLADEINRASPKTQSALLQVMEEHEVTVDGVNHEIGKIFTVIATQNPIEQAGTYRLPEAQLDRFMIKTSIGRVEQNVLIQIIGGVAVSEVSPDLIDLRSLESMQRVVSEVTVSEPVAGYISALVEASHNSEFVRLGVSVRGALALTQLARTWALVHGRDFVVPQDVSDMLPLVFGHRILLQAEAEFDGLTVDRVIAEILAAVPVPQGA
ncbi:MoxR family ATPase [Leucobacter sp. OH1287]|uniref:AAA family ATPase n=1 Tax=Leucobacter sp. OH1287 TaxID=2491049 RepID=UPI000F5F4FCB|nr:MoxR family ATPase [Leucobacter sp. OH1287]RRD61490.1 MoxR family ATPase [Leucobacter sp. OH1287]